MNPVTTIDIDYLRGWIGRQEVASESVSAELVSKYRATFDMPEIAIAIGDPAPRFIHFCLTTPIAAISALGLDGHPKRCGFLPPVPLPRRMWAGGALEFSGDVRVGDDVERMSRIEDVVVKEGRSGTLCFVTVAHRVEAAGRLVVSERQDIVYRADESGTKPTAPPPAAPPGVHQCSILPTSTLLFRYSALTFNGHRIHYDRDYAKTIEGYPGLVVHGPMQAVLLYYFAGKINSREPVRFSYRGLSPAFDQEKLFLHAGEVDGKMRLWTARSNGPVAMSAEAEWA